MQVRFVGPDDLLPRGFLTVDVVAIPRVGDTIAFEGVLGDQYTVRDVWWSVHTSRIDGEIRAVSQIPEVAIESFEDAHRTVQ